MNEHERTEFANAVRRRLGAILAALACSVGLALVNVAYVEHVQDQAAARDVAIRRESDARWCALLGRYVRAYRDEPPSTQLGRDIAAELTALWREFGCA